MVTRAGRVVLGVDLGKLQTPATIIAVETKSTATIWDPVRISWIHGPGSKGRIAVVRRIESIPLGTSYDGVARRIWYLAEEVGASEIWMDGTGVGVAVEEMVRKRKPSSLKCLLRALTITGGQTTSQTSVPRRELLINSASSGITGGQSEGAQGIKRLARIAQGTLGSGW